MSDLVQDFKDFLEDKAVYDEANGLLKRFNDIVKCPHIANAFKFEVVKPPDDEPKHELSE